MANAVVVRSLLSLSVSENVFTFNLSSVIGVDTVPSIRRCEVSCSLVDCFLQRQIGNAVVQHHFSEARKKFKSFFRVNKFPKIPLYLLARTKRW